MQDIFSLSSPRKRNHQLMKANAVNNQEISAFLDMTSLVITWFTALFEFLAVC
jgi:hypothetical protein